MTDSDRFEPWPSRPHGTEDRCCFACEHSSTNPALFTGARPDLFKAKVSRGVDGLVHCFRFLGWGGHLMFGYEVCGEFRER